MTQIYDYKVGKIKILVLNIQYALSMASYFIKALQHRDDVELITCGPDFGNFMPWLNGITVPSRYAPKVDISLPKELTAIGEVNYDFVKSHLPSGWIPDLVLNVDAGLHWKFKPSDGYVATVATDPHVLSAQYELPRSYSDKFFNMQKVYIPAGSKDIWLPYAYSKYDFYPDDTVSKDVDAVLIGMPYDNRVRWVDELRKRGLKVTFENGPIYDEARNAYNRGRIGLNWSSMQDLNCRAFELAAMKLCPVMNYVPDVSNFELFSHYLYFSDLNDAIKQVLWANDNPEKSKEMAELVYKEVQPHTFDSRVQTILSECRF